MPRVTHGYAFALWLLATLFLCRVLGQVIVAIAAPAWLPPMAEWYSGLLPYPLLLPTQIAILALMLRLNLGVGRHTAWLSVRRPRAGTALLGFAAAYAAVMAVRYLISGELHPERRFWPPGSIPIAFHFVLAGYLAALGRYTRSRPGDAA